MTFKTRPHAGRVLAGLLRHYSDQNDVVVLGLPRGGVPVAFEVAQELHAPLDVFLVRKLEVPGREELTMGAIASGGVPVLNDDTRDALGIPNEIVDRVVAKQRRELVRREALYRSDRPWPDLRGKTIILVDDGLATGSTMKVAAEALRLQCPARIVVAVPVAARSTCEEFEGYVDEIICAETPSPFYAVDEWYEDYSPTSDREVKTLLDEATRSRAVGSA